MYQQKLNFPQPFKSEQDELSSGQFNNLFESNSEKIEEEHEYKDRIIDDEEAFEKYYEKKMLEERKPIDQEILLENMREDHNLRLKDGVLMGVRAEEGIRVCFDLIKYNF